MAFLDIAIRAVDQASDTFRDISREAEDFGDEVRDAADDAAKSVGDLGSAVGDAASKVEESGHRMAGAMGGVGEAGGNAERGLMGVADTSEFLATQLGLPLGPAEGLASSFANLGGGIEALVQGFGGIITQVGAILGPLAAKAAAWWAVAAGVIAANLPLIAIIATIALVAAGLAYFFTQTEAGKKTLEALKDVVDQQVMPAFNKFSDFFTNVLLPVIETAIKIYLLPLKAAFELISTTLREVVGIVTALIRGDFAGAWAHAQALVQGFVDFFIGVPTQILELLGGLAGQLWDLAANAVDQLRLGAINAAIALMAWFMELPGEIVRWLGEVGSLLWGAGKAIALSLLNGLKAGWNAVKDEVGSWGGKIASLKGPIEEDMTLLYDEGVAIATGLDNGLRDGFWSHIDITTGMIKTEYQHLYYDELVPQAVSAGAAAGQAYAQAFVNYAGGSLAGGFGSGGSPTGGAGSPGSPIPGDQFAGDLPTIWDPQTNTWRKMTQAEWDAHIANTGPGGNIVHPGYSYGTSQIYVGPNGVPYNFDPTYNQQTQAAMAAQWANLSINVLAMDSQSFQQWLTTGGGGEVLTQYLQTSKAY